jgi:diguanylate cyclase
MSGGVYFQLDEAMSRPLPAKPSKPDLSHHAFSILSRLRIEVTPVNFELMYEIVSGNNPELRKRFAELGQNITRSDIEILARQYLPHHFGESIFERSASSVQDELSNFKKLLSGGQDRLSSFSTTLISASDRFSKIDPRDTKSISRELEQISQAAAEQNSATSDMMQSISRQIATIDTLSEEIKEVEASKFLHTSTGLGNRRAFNKRLAELYKAGPVPEGWTLVFGRIFNLEVFERSELLKAKEFLMERLGSQARQQLQGDDAGFWLDNPHLAFLINGVYEDDIRGFTQRLQSHFETQLKTVRRTAPGLPGIYIAFGCASTYTAQNAASMIHNCDAALQNALMAGSGATIFFASAERGGDGRNYALYGRQELTL